MTALASTFYRHDRFVGKVRDACSNAPDLRSDLLGLRLRLRPSFRGLPSWRGHASQPPIVLRKRQSLRPLPSRVCCAAELQYSAWRKLILPRPGIARRSKPFCSKRVRHVYLIRLSGNGWRYYACLSATGKRPRPAGRISSLVLKLSSRRCARKAIPDKKSKEKN